MVNELGEKKIIESVRRRELEQESDDSGDEEVWTKLMRGIAGSGVQT